MSYNYFVSERNEMKKERFYCHLDNTKLDRSLYPLASNRIRASGLRKVSVPGVNSDLLCFLVLFEMSGNKRKIWACVSVIPITDHTYLVPGTVCHRLLVPHNSTSGTSSIFAQGNNWWLVVIAQDLAQETSRVNTAMEWISQETINADQLFTLESLSTREHQKSSWKKKSNIWPINR